jgi:hypothetical protein
MKFPRTGADDFLLMREVLLVSGYKLGILQHAQSTPRYPQLTLFSAIESLERMPLIEMLYISCYSCLPLHRIVRALERV